MYVYTHTYVALSQPLGLGDGARRQPCAGGGRKAHDNKYTYVCVYTYIYIYIYMYMHIYVYAYIYIYMHTYIHPHMDSKHTPGLHSKIPAHKIFARVWAAQKSFFLIGNG